MKGILFKSEVWSGKLRALKECGEAETRRLIKPQPETGFRIRMGVNIAVIEEDKDTLPRQQDYLKLRYKVGETVYVKEAWCYKVDPITAILNENEFWYRSTNPEVVKVDGDGGIQLTKEGYEASPWISPLFMPERAARYFIEILEVRPERLQDITEEGALREGMTDVVEGCYPTSATFMPPEWYKLPSHEEQWSKEWHPDSPRMKRWQCRNNYIRLWDSINKQNLWETNSWVWVYRFKLSLKLTGEH